ncbi:hypothetical protein Csa_021765, partial [Cucumis sativus]
MVSHAWTNEEATAMAAGVSGGAELGKYALHKTLLQLIVTMLDKETEQSCPIASSCSNSTKSELECTQNLQHNLKPLTKLLFLELPGIGRPLALLIKMSMLVVSLNLYDIDFTRPSELANALKGVDVIVIPAGVSRKSVKSLVEAVADNCPNAFIHIISNPVNSTVPIAAEGRTRPSVSFTHEQIQELTVRIQNAGIEVVEAKARAGSVESSFHALDRDSDGLSKYGQKALEALKLELKTNIEK